ncbi:hypothetical protein [Alteriqipengyuania sp.]|uniref:hypothetical protein n=1 Tax=Alteriqipengyuania sp. TaxID=2800692 RepID=UPI0035166FA5
MPRLPESLADLSRCDATLRIRCRRCLHFRGVRALTLMRDVHDRRLGHSLENVSRHLVCARCGARGAKIELAAEF